MLTIRLARGGAKKNPYYRLVVTDSRKARDSGAIKEKIGFFNPVAAGEEVMLHMDTERVDYWISHGAQASPKAEQLIKLFKKAQANGEKAVMRTKPKKAKPAPITEAIEEAAPAEAEAPAEKPAVEAVETEAQPAEPAKEDAAPEAEAPAEKPAIEAVETEAQPAEPAKDDTAAAEESKADEATTEKKAEDA